ncbi:Class II Aldolase and Adducin Nterminal domain containing protein [Leishmania braziliensis]|nr:Class II Aldolase and Adducin Nterminal domain containing protein [Leishmania braziliensis]CAJ2476407.1 unnamed protein product [Leishmania braziliensis]
MSVILPESHPEHPFNLIPELCRRFYDLGWATGTGGGISIKMGDNYYVAPSGVQKERIKSNEIFVLNSSQDIVEEPRTDKRLKMSECTPLFFNAYRMRNAGACLHTHSVKCVLISLLCDREFRISHIEMLKGISNNETKKALGFRDTLIVPIIENTDFEKDLTASMAECMEKYPESCAVLVRRHGMYVWSDTWQKAKGAVECIDYLMGLAIQMKQLGLEWEPKDVK